jgi:hypothetical protein
MKYADEIASGDVIQTPGLVTTGTGIQVMLRLLPHTTERVTMFVILTERIYEVRR